MVDLLFYKGAYIAKIACECADDCSGEIVSMGYAGSHVIEFVTETVSVPYRQQVSYVEVDGVRHEILPKTLAKFRDCSNAKEYAEAVEYFAYLVLIKKSIWNDAYFGE